MHPSDHTAAGQPRVGDSGEATPQLMQELEAQCSVLARYLS